MIVNSGSMKEVASSLHRVGTERAHGVDLLGHLHGPEFAGDARRVAAGNHDGGENRSQFAHQGDGDNAAGLIDLAVIRQRAGHLQRHDGAAEETDQRRDGEAADPDGVHLKRNIVAVVGGTEYVPEGGACKNEELLNRENQRFQQVEQWGRS